MSAPFVIEYQGLCQNGIILEENIDYTKILVTQRENYNHTNK